MSTFRAMSRLLAAAALCVSAACGAAEPDTAVTVAMRDNRFDPARTTVERGTTVRWVNEGQMPHNTRATNGAWQSGNVAPGQSYSFRFEATGTFDYACTLHPGMNGTIVVQ